MEIKASEDCLVLCSSCCFSDASEGEDEDADSDSGFSSLHFYIGTEKLQKKFPACFLRTRGHGDVSPVPLPVGQGKRPRVPVSSVAVFFICAKLCSILSFFHNICIIITIAIKGGSIWEEAESAEENCIISPTA